VSGVNDLQNKINKQIKFDDEADKISIGTSVLPARQGILIRILGNSAEDVKKVVFEVLRTTRKQIIGASFSGIRKA
jgi:urease accessory protein UreH